MGDQQPAAPAAQPIQAAWKKFAVVVMDPWVLVFTVASVVLFLLGRAHANSSLSTLVQLLQAVATGVLGGTLANKINSVSAESTLLTRGKVAVRSLKLLLRKAAAMESRVGQFLGARDHIETNPEVTVRNYQEVIQDCRLLQEDVISSIENWTDIVPEANIGSAIGVISDLNATVEAKEAEMTALRAENAAKQNQTDAELAAQRAELERRSQEINGLKSKLRRAESEVLGAALRAPDVSLSQGRKIWFAGSAGDEPKVDWAALTNLVDLANPKKPEPPA